MRTKVISCILAAAIIFSCGSYVYVSGQKEAGAGAYEQVMNQDGFLYGINLPWLGGSYNNSYGPNHALGLGSGFSLEILDQALYNSKAIGFNAVRVWMFKSLQGIQFADNGDITGLDPEFLGNVKTMLDLSKEYGVNLQITIQPHIDVSLCAGNVSKDVYDKYTQFLVKPAFRKNYIDKAVTPLLNLLKDYQENILIIDAYSEPETDVYDASLPVGTTWENVATVVKDIVSATKKVMPNMVVTATSGSEGHEAIIKGEYDDLGIDLYGVTNFNDFGDVTPVRDMKVVKPVILNTFGVETYSNTDNDFQVISTDAFYENSKSSGYRGAFYWMYGGSNVTDAMTLIDMTGEFRPVVNTIHAAVRANRYERQGINPSIDKPSILYTQSAEEIRWLPTRGTSSYMVERRKAGSSNWEEAGEIDVMTMQGNGTYMFSDTDAEPGKYIYRVTAVGYGGEKAVSDISQEVEIEEPVLPEDITGEWLTEGWDEAYRKARIQIGSHTNMLNWFDGVFDGDEKDGRQNNYFEDNTGMNGYFRPNYWVIVDLGRPVEMTGYILDSFAVKGYDFYGSDDGETWTQISRSVKSNKEDLACGLFYEGTTVQYVKFQVTNRSQNDGDSVHGWINIVELQLFGNPTTEDPGLPDPTEGITGNWLTEGWTSQMVSENITCGTNDNQMKKWFDGQIYKEGDSGPLQDNYIENKSGEGNVPVLSDTYWVEIDLGQKAPLTALHMITETVRTFTVYGRNSSSESWVEIGKVVDNRLNDAVCLFPEKPEYQQVRIFMDQYSWSGDPYNGWFNVSEIKIYGDADPYTPEPPPPTEDPEGMWLNQGWDASKINSNVKIDSEMSNWTEKMQRWFNGITSGEDDNNYIEKKDGEGNVSPRLDLYWASIDFDEQVDLTGLRLFTKNVNAFTVYGSDDGTSWAEIKKVTGNYAEDIVVTFPEGTTYRYAKFKVDRLTQHDTNEYDGWCSVLELKFFGIRNEVPWTEPEAAMPTGTWLKDLYSEIITNTSKIGEPGKWFDGAGGDPEGARPKMWCEDTTGREGGYCPAYTVIVDLGEARDLTGFQMVAGGGDGNPAEEGRAIPGFQFYGTNTFDEGVDKNDHTGWELLYECRENTDRFRPGVFEEGTSYRYVKFVITKDADPVGAGAWINISEIKLYGNVA